MITKIYRNYTASRFLKKGGKFIGLLKSKPIRVLRRIVIDGNFENVHEQTMPQIKELARINLKFKIQDYCKHNPGAAPYGDYFYQLRPENEVVREK